MQKDPKIINLAKLSWKELKPEDDYDVKLEVNPEIIERHEEMVQCYLANDFDPQRVIRIMTKFKQEFGDLEESAQKWHFRLIDCLKKLCRNYDKAAARRK